MIQFSEGSSKFRVPDELVSEAIPLLEERIDELKKDSKALSRALESNMSKRASQLYDASRQEMKQLVRQKKLVTLSQEEYEAKSKIAQEAREQLPVARALLETLQERNDKIKEQRKLRRALARLGAVQASKYQDMLDKNAELQGELRYLNTQEGLRLTRLRLQNEELEEQIDRQRFLNELKVQGLLDEAMTAVRLDVQGVALNDKELRRSIQNQIPDQVKYKGPRFESLADLEMTMLNQRFDAQSRYYTRLDDLRQYNAERHRIMLEAMEMNQWEWFTSTTQGLQMMQRVASTTFGGFAELSKTAFELSGGHLKGFWAMYKGFAIAEAVASTWVAANKALASAPPPYNFALAAGVVAAGLANVAKIASTSPSSRGAGGTGGGQAPFMPAPQRGADRTRGVSAGRARGDHLDFSGSSGRPIGSASPGGASIHTATSAPDMRAGGRQQQLEVEHILTPKVLPNGDIGWAVEEYKRRKKR